MLARKSVRLAVIALAAALALVLLLYPTDEKRVRAAAEALLAGANEGGLTLSAALEQHTVEHVVVTVAELPAPLEGRPALIGAVQRARALDPRLRFRAQAMDVTVQGKTVRVNADLVVGLPQASIAPRHAVAMFEKRDGAFRLVSAEIGATRRDEPEERP